MEQKRKIVPPVYLLAALILMTVMHFTMPLAEFVPDPYNYGGALLVVLGLGLAAVSARAFKAADTGIVPFDEATALVTSGLYRYTRNPMYLGMVFLLLGTAILFGTAGSALPIPFFVWIIHNNFIVGEERFMEEAFGEQYLEFKSRVRRWL